MQRQNWQATHVFALLAATALQAGVAAEATPGHNELRDRGSLTEAPARIRSRGTLTASGAPVPAPEEAGAGLRPGDVERERALLEALRRDWRQADLDGDGRLDHAEFAAFRQRMQYPGEPGPGAPAQASTRLRR